MGARARPWPPQYQSLPRNLGMQKPSTYGAPLLLALAVWGSQAQAASVLGRAVRKDGSNPEGMCHATLSPELDRHGAPDPDFANSPDGLLSSLLNQNGEFQFPRVPPANYVLAVECPTTSAVREVRVQ